MSESALPYIVKKVGDREIKLGKISPRDRAEMLRRLKATAREKIVANLKTSELPGERVYTELDDFDQQPWGFRQFMAHVNSEDGEYEICEIAWKKYNQGDPAPDLEAIALQEDDSRLIGVCIAVANLKFTDKTQKPTTPPPEGEGPNPSAPGTHYGA